MYCLEILTEQIFNRHSIIFKKRMWADSHEYTENPQIFYFDFVIKMCFYYNYTGSNYVLNKKYTYMIK